MFLCLLLLPVCMASRILFIPEHNSPSHTWSMMAFADGLRNSGHSISFLDLNTKDKPTITYNRDIEVIHINVTGVPEEIQDYEAGVARWMRRARGAVMWKSYLEAENVFKLSVEQSKSKYDAILNTNWDLVVVDSQNPTSRMSMFVPTPLDDYKPYNPTSMFERLDQIGDYFLKYATMIKLVPYYMNLHKEWNSHSFEWKRLFSDAAFIASDSIDELGHPAAGSVNYISGGSYCANSSQNQLSEELREFLEDKESKGSIYIALGSMNRWEFAPKRVKLAFEQALNRLTEYRIIFVYPFDDLHFLSHVRVVNWTNQAAVLAHPSMKVFLTHGGLKSFREGLCAVVPLVILPLFAEQTHNARIAIERKIAIPLNKYTLNAEILERQLRKATDTSMKTAIISNKNLYLDHPRTEINRLVWWAERAIRKGVKPLSFTIKGTELNWLRFLYFDSLSLLALLTSAIYC